MAAENSKQSADRRKRVQLLKKLIIISLITSILVPTVLCVVLFVRVHVLEGQIAQLEGNLAEAREAWAEMDTRSSQEDEVQGFIVEPEVEADSEISDENTGDTGILVQDSQSIELQEGVRKVYLTFDDGPSTYTDEILDILSEYDVKATFFVIGKEGEWAEELYKRIAQEGHTIGLHSYSHVYDEIYVSVDAYAEDLHKLQEYVYSLTGIWSRYIRFPGGSSNKVSDLNMREFITYLNEEGLTYFDWNISSQDATSQSLTAEQIVENSLEGIEKSDTIIILFHDAAGKATTVEALPIVIEKVQAMENTVLLPITDDTVPVQHITIAQEETED